jgi:hypothetical protein
VQGQLLNGNQFTADFVVPASPAAGRAGFQARGATANIDLELTPKGTGRLRFGTRTASADVPVTGYVEIIDAAGTVRRLAVVG